MAANISTAMRHLYFPINWANPTINSRALAYQISREHSTVTRQLYALFKAEINYVDHVHDYVNRRGERVIYRVPCYQLTHLQVKIYLKKHSPAALKVLPEGF